MKKILLAVLLISSYSFAQECCNVIDGSGNTVITKNGVCVSTSNATTTACLDQDGDGVVDSKDKCPTIAGTLNGCPDSDKDGVINSKDKCPNIAGTLNGCPDSDKDGVINSKDKCPNIAGTLNGCPDSDKDGVINSKDKCPNIAGTLNGCPDSDKDGVVNSKDKCPNIAGTKEHHGCPALTKEAIETLGNYAKTIQFNSGKSSFKSGVVSTLDKVAKVMKDFGDISFKINGYTDSDGSAAANLKLSESRAKAVLEYLASHGIDKTRLKSKGYGEASPIASNKTRAGKAQNRRVEIIAE